MEDSIPILNRSYKEYFLDHQERITRNFKELKLFLIERNCTFKGESMPTLLKPNFISTDQANILSDRVERMSRILDKFITLFIGHKSIRDIMGFSKKENVLFDVDPGYSNPLVISRLDAFLNGLSLKFLEFNCDSPAGIAYSDVLEEGFHEMFKQYPFLSSYRLGYLERQEQLLKVLIECYSEFSKRRPGFPDNPVIAIIDWADVSTYSEFELHQVHFESNGYRTVIGSPQDFRIEQGKAYVRDVEVHLVYRRVITREILEKWSEVKTFVKAVGDGLVCCCNSFRSYIVGNKKVLSILTDPEFEYLFSEEEVKFIKENIPWTRVLADTDTTYQGETISLKSFISENRNTLVMKPGNMYGGKDVFVGRETDQKRWEEIMNQHLLDDIWVVQEYVDIPMEEFPEISDGVKFKSKYVNINPFSLLGKYSGTITRVSDSLVINVSAGGGLVPTITAENIGE